MKKRKILLNFNQKLKQHYSTINNIRSEAYKKIEKNLVELLCVKESHFLENFSYKQMSINQNQVIAICLNKNCHLNRLIQNNQVSLMSHKEHIVDCLMSKYWSYTILKEKNKIQCVLDKIKNNSVVNDIEKQKLESKLSQLIEKYNDAELIKNYSTKTQQQNNKLESILLDCYNHKVEYVLIWIINECSNNRESKSALIQIVNDIYSLEDMKYLILSFYQKGEILQFIGKDKEAIEYYNYVLKITNSIAEEKQLETRINVEESGNPSIYV